MKNILSECEKNIRDIQFIFIKINKIGFAIDYRDMLNLWKPIDDEKEYFEEKIKRHNNDVEILRRDLDLLFK